MNKKTKIIARISLVIFILGALILCLGSIINSENIWHNLLMFGGAAIMLFSPAPTLIVIRNDKKWIKKVSIEQKDERNLEIAKLSKAKAFDAFSIIFPITAMFFSLWRNDIKTTIFLSVWMILPLIYQLYYLNKINKKM